jgi:UDP-N-acetylmuramate dehydrogenase
MIWSSDVSLKPYNTFGMDVKGKWMVEVTCLDELREAIADARWINSNRLVLGGGSNVLLTQDFDGVVMLNRFMGIAHTVLNDDEVLVSAASGEVWHSFVLHCIAQGWCGVENLSLIPGCVGASPIQNIGAYGVEIKDVFHSLDAVHTATGELRTFVKEECAFGYRESIFKQKEKGNWVITNVVFKLSLKPNLKTGYGDIQKELESMKLDTMTIQSVSQAICNIRSSKLPNPSVLGNAGSFFKNPVVLKAHYMKLKDTHPLIPSYPIDADHVKVPAGWLIEHRGWKGKRAGACGVNEKQALVLVNYGGAKGQEVLDLSQQIIDDIQEHFQIVLEREVNIL